MDDNVTTVHVTKALTSAAIVELLETYSNLSEITCAPSVYDRTSKRYIDALDQLGIEVKKKYNWGAKPQTHRSEFKVAKLSDKGLKPKEIAERLGISLNRVYYLLRLADAKFDNRHRKHNHRKIRQLKSEGLSAKEIADELDMPIRSVYYILNKK
ncbi:helix-turn-helix domain-containing protein [Methanobrevibacter sp.]|uniref:helix-turn-helix domain-containing protein n=1 Tax=Methanobrevibacter sp. TaxID=66852 RepID=UPI003863BAA3